MIVFEDCTIYDAGVQFHLSKDKVTLDKIIIPTDSTNYTASIIAHEKTHVLTFNNINIRTVFENNNELFPIFLQKLMLSKLDDQYSIILDQIIRTIETKQSFQHLVLAKHLNTNQNSTVLDKQMSTYYNLVGYNYLLSELYSHLLMAKCSEDEEKMIRKLNQVLNNKLSIPDFLASYQIGLTNKNLIPIVREETNKCKRITIIP